MPPLFPGRPRPPFGSAIGAAKTVVRRRQMARMEKRAIVEEMRLK
jgi:hypothetical protein